jgi:hypothetical protein
MTKKLLDLLIGERVGGNIPARNYQYNGRGAALWRTDASGD